MQISPNNSSDRFSPTFEASSSVSKENALLTSVFSWMTAGLLLTGIVGAYVMTSPAITGFVMKNMLMLSFAQIGIVLWLSFRVMKMSAPLATAVFLGYSALNGLTIAPILSFYSQASISTAFMLTAMSFGSMAIYGKVTKRDLSGLGSFMMMGFFGAFIAMLVNLFIGSPMISWVTSIVFVVACVGITAWEVQKIKHVAHSVSPGDVDFRRVSICSALSLYLNFIIIFQNLLRLMGSQD